MLRGQSNASDPQQAVKEVLAQIAQPSMALIMVFCSPSYAIAEVVQAFNTAVPHVKVVGCTTAGEIGPFGYAEDSISAASLDSEYFTCETLLIESVRTIDLQNLQQQVEKGLQDAGSHFDKLDHEKSFALMLIDGLCKQEEAITWQLHHSLGSIPLFGASAGDAENFKNTYVIHNGRYHSNAAVVVIVKTNCPFRVFKDEHFIGSDDKMVVTEANPQRRIVTEINGEPAAEEYARMVGLAGKTLTPMIFAAYPVVVRIGGEFYVRSIQKVNEDGSLTFFCAIDEGIVLTVALDVNLRVNLQQRFEQIKQEIGPFQMLISFDCFLRKLELKQNQQLDVVSRLLRNNNAIGFSTYGEQYQAMHVNQTFTGVALGYAE